MAALLLAPAAHAVTGPPAAIAPGAWAQAPPDSGLAAPALADSAASKVVEVGRAAPAPRRGPATTPRFSQPRWVMLRSLAVPGWGQLDNGSWLKAALVAGVETRFAVQLLDDNRQLDRLSRAADAAQAANDEDAFNAAVNAYNSRLAESVNRRWLLGGAIVYALIDAYVDAHFRNFRIEFENDPALPEGALPQGKAKLSMRWAF